MKALFLHVKNYFTRIERPSNNISIALIRRPDSMNELLEEGLLVLYQVEPKDGERQIKRLKKDLRKISKHLNVNEAKLGAFAHLSSDLASPDIAKNIAQKVALSCQEIEELDITHSNFGYDKETMIHISAHPHSVKFRSY